MEDLASMISQFLGSEEGMSQLRQVASALGMPDPSGSEVNSSTASSPLPQGFPDLSALLGGMAGQGQPQNQSQNSFQSQGAEQRQSQNPFQSQPQGQPPAAPALDFSTLMMLQKTLSSFNQPDKNTDLLRALKPHFSAERAKKVDDAVKIIGLIRLLPLIKESGLFGGASK